MGQNKEQLKKLLLFIDNLAKQPGNEWFVEELVKRTVSDTSGFDAFIRLQREKSRKKARFYYKDITNTKLRNQLIDYHSSMIWYKSIFDVENFFVNVYYQIEDMLNYYIDNFDAFNKISNNPSFFCKIIGNDKFEMNIDCQSYFFDKKENSYKRRPINKINSLWAKLLFWSLDTNHFEFLQNQFQNFSSIINIRNDRNHANYLNTSKSADYWNNHEDDYAYAFIYAIIKFIRNTII